MMSEENTVRETPTGDPMALKLAVFLVVLALLLQSGAVAYGNYIDHRTLRTAIQSQAPAIEEIDIVRTQLSAIASKTFQLGEQGNVTAARIVEQMRAAGVNFNAATSGEGGGP